jgi:hypothetical protein
MKGLDTMTSHVIIDTSKTAENHPVDNLPFKTRAIAGKNELSN